VFGTVKQLHYKITVGVPLNSNAQYELSGGPLYNDCNCNIISGIKHTSKMYIGTSCNIPIIPETNLDHNEYLCWEVIVDDERKVGAELEIISIKETSFSKTIEVVDAVLLKCKEGTTCEKGRAYAIFRPSTSDWSELSMTVKFQSVESTKSEGMNVKYFGFNDDNGDNDSNDVNDGDDDNNKDNDKDKDKGFLGELKELAALAVGLFLIGGGIYCYCRTRNS